jgi:LemA protein
MLTGALKSMFALAEAYPDLKANTNFLDLQETLKMVEDDINLARRYYNGAVQAYNTAIQMFPANILANIFGFKDADFFEAEVGERENVSTEF